MKIKNNQKEVTMSKLHFKYGAMNSGKSDMLIKTAYNYTECGLVVLVIKPEKDTKSDKYVVTRAGLKRKVDVIAKPETNLWKTINNYELKAKNKLNCVLVDESQFLTKEQIDQLYKIAKNNKISVICYGLRADFRSMLFPGSKRLFEIADNIEKIPTMCRCGSQAEFNCRKKSGKYIFSGEQVAIDGIDDISYDSLCGECYLREKDKSL